MQRQLRQTTRTLRSRPRDPASHPALADDSMFPMDVTNADAATITDGVGTGLYRSSEVPNDRQRIRIEHVQLLFRWL
jgi:hypothetical protein